MRMIVTVSSLSVIQSWARRCPGQNVTRDANPIPRLGTENERSAHACRGAHSPVPGSSGLLDPGGEALDQVEDLVARPPSGPIQTFRHRPADVGQARHLRARAAVGCAGGELRLICGHGSTDGPALGENGVGGSRFFRLLGVFRGVVVSLPEPR